MATVPSSVNRIDDPSGDSFLTFDTGGNKAQGVVVINENGQHAGITGFPLVVSGTVGIDSSTPVAITPAPAGTAWGYDTDATGDDTAVLTAQASATLYELRVLLDPAVLSDRYVFLFDQAATPGVIGNLRWRGVLPQDGELSETFQYGLTFTNGIVIGISSTIGGFAVTSSSEAFIHARGFYG